MSKRIDIPSNIWRIIDHHSGIYGRCSREVFSIDIHQSVEHHKITSPIEQALYSAIKCLQFTNDIPGFSVGDGCSDCPIDRPPVTRGLLVVPQYELGKYRADFYLSFSKKGWEKSLVVECDSQEFHENTERERRYEKARDRYFIHQGFTVFHYTGAEILQNSLGVAAECLSYVTDIPSSDLFGSIVNFEE